MTSVNMINHKAFNTVFSSELDLAGFEPTSDNADVEIRFGEVPAQLNTVIGSGQLWSINNDEALINVPGIASYQVKNGQEIIVSPTAETGSEASYLMGVPMGACLIQRGFLVLHGSAVKTPFGVVVLAGANGAGKSTLAMAIATAYEGSLICDDLAVIEQVDTSPIVHCGPSSLRLWEDMAKEFGFTTNSSARISPDINKYSFAMNPSFCRSAMISSVICIETPSGSTPKLVKLDHIQGTIAVMRNHFRGKIARLLSKDSLKTSASLASKVPIYNLTRPLSNFKPAKLAEYICNQLP